MKALLEKIRKILRNRRTRQLLARTVSGFAAVVVFVTTYALVLPAITMEQEASCGITAHEHTDTCYEERLVCEIPEDDNHHHDASCYEKFLICGQEVHVHSTECYQQYTSAVASSGSTKAASTDFGASAESGLYDIDSSDYDAETTLTDSGSSAIETVEEDSSASADDSDLILKADSSEVIIGADPETSGSGTSENRDSDTTNPEDVESQSSEENKIGTSEEDKAAMPKENKDDALEKETVSWTDGENNENGNLGQEQGDSPDVSDGFGSASDASDRPAADISDVDRDTNDSAHGVADAKLEGTETADTEAGGTADTEVAAQEAASSATTNALPETVENENLAEGYVPELDSIEFGSVLNKNTDFYYFHPEDGEEIPADSGEVADWKQMKNGLFGSTELESTDLVKLYLSYTIPAGALNETNQVARYRLPSNIHLTDEQIIAINGTENGMSALYADAAASDTGETAQDENTANYQKYLGAEAIEGTRRPDQQLKEGEPEYISAIVKAENVFDDEGLYGEKGAYLGQDLIFIFTPYSIEKNQTTYNADGDPVSAGEKITGWFACDFNMSQIDWVEEDIDLDNSTVEKTAEVVFVEKDSEKNLKEISRTLKLIDVTDSHSDAAGGETARAADLEHAVNGPFKSGTLTADGDGYRITLDYSEEAKIPENAELSVKEITAETDREAYETCLEQAGQQVAANDKTSVDQKASRFFDIEILEKVSAKEKDNEGKEEVRKIEPSAPVSVNIQIIDDHTSEDAVSADQKASQGDPAVLHFAGEGVEQIDSTVKSSQKLESSEGKNSTGKGSEPTGSATEISFEAESFSIYGVVYTVDFAYEVDGKSYQFSLPGGGFVSFTDLVEVLGITRDTNSDEDESEAEMDTAQVQVADGMLDVTASDDAKKFVDDVASIEFSSPYLVWTGKADDKTTVGALKKDKGLECQYSAELTKEQIKDINAQTVEAGDWALISMQPFTSEETLTVTMKNGEVFTVNVTDAQISTMFLSDSGEMFEVTVTYGSDAQIPDGSRLVVTEYGKNSEEYLAAWDSVVGSAEKSAADTGSEEEGIQEEKSGSFSLAVSGSNENEEATDQTEQNLIIAENVVPYTFGMAAFDLSIYDADGNPVEPKAEVEVSILMKERPADVETDVLASSLAVQHLNESTCELEVETVASVRDALLGEIEVREDSITADFTVDSFSTYTITWGGWIKRAADLQYFYRRLYYLCTGCQ